MSFLGNPLERLLTIGEGEKKSAVKVHMNIFLVRKISFDPIPHFLPPPGHWVISDGSRLYCLQLITDWHLLIGQPKKPSPLLKIKLSSTLVGHLTKVLDPSVVLFFIIINNIQPTMSMGLISRPLESVESTAIHGARQRLSREKLCNSRGLY